MFERMSREDARHVIQDFFEIHTDAEARDAGRRARRFLGDIEASGAVCLGTLPTLRVERAILFCLPENYEPEDIYLVRRDSNGKNASKKIRLAK